MMYLGGNRVKEAKVQTLKSEFEGLRMKESELVDNFAIRLTTIVNKIQALGEKVEESYVVKKLLCAVPNKFLQIASTIEQFGDFKTMTVEEVIGQLKAYEDQLTGHGDASKEHILLTRAEWEAKTSKKEGKGSCSDTKSKEGGGHGRGDGERANKSSKNNKFNIRKVKCYNCQDFGHFASDYRSKKKDDRAHLTEKYDDDEPTLLVAETCELVMGLETSEEIMLNEDKVKPNHGV